MALVINTNISSLGAQRQLSGSGMTLDRATERLSSGLRVNSAKDDAAGLAIATRMTSQVRGLDQAVRNANDGVSLIQTAEGALQESTNILQRMRELAVQSSNGIYSDSDRKTLDAENKQLVAELDRIAKTTSFNGKNLLDGSLGKVDLQVGASQGQTISFAIKTMDSKNLGLGSTTSDLSGDDIKSFSAANLTTTAASFDFSAAKTTLNVTVGGKTEVLDLTTAVTNAATLTTAVTTNGSNATKLANLGLTFDNTGFHSASGQNITIDGGNANTTTAFGVTTTGVGTSSTDGVANLAQGSVVINGQGLKGTTNFGVAGTGNTTLKDVLDDINKNVSGVTAEGFNIGNATTVGTGLLAGTDNLRLTLGAIDGGASTNYDISKTANMDELVAKINDATGGKIVAAKDENGKLTLSNTTGGEITVKMSTTTTPATAVTGAKLGTITGIAETGSTGITTFKGNISLKSEDGSPITITAGANGTDADLAVLGFRTTEGAGKVLGGSLNSTGQNAALANNDLKINGQDIGVVAANAGLAAKVNAINSFSDTTGVSASAVADKSFKMDPLATTSQVVGTTNTALVTGGTITLNGVDIALTSTDTTLQQVNKINAVATSTGVQASIDNNGFMNLFSDSSITLKTDGRTSFVADNTLGVGSATATGPVTKRLVGTAVATNAPVATTTLVINGTATADLSGMNVAAQIAAINAITANTGVTASLGTDVADLNKLVLTSTAGGALAVITGGEAGGTALIAQQGIGGAAASVQASNYTVAEAKQVTGAMEVNGTAISFTNLQDKDTVVNDFNAQSANTGVTAKIDENGALKLSSSSTITLKTSGANSYETARALGVSFSSNTVGGADKALDTLVIDPKINLKSANATPISVEVSAAGASATGLLNQNTSLASTVTGSAISNLSIATKAGASAALKSIDTALDTINDTRSQLGSINNRLDFTVANLTSISEKTTAARSRIVDADFAQETANLSRSTVLQQAATAMLAQANQRPQNVLSLLR